MTYILHGTTDTLTGRAWMHSRRRMNRKLQRHGIASRLAKQSFHDWCSSLMRGA